MSPLAPQEPQPPQGEEWPDVEGWLAAEEGPAVGESFAAEEGAVAGEGPAAGEGPSAAAREEARAWQARPRLPLRLALMFAALALGLALLLVGCPRAGRRPAAPSARQPPSDSRPLWPLRSRPLRVPGYRAGESAAPATARTPAAAAHERNVGERVAPARYAGTRDAPARDAGVRNVGARDAGERRAAAAASGPAPPEAGEQPITESAGVEFGFER